MNLRNLIPIAGLAVLLIGGYTFADDPRGAGGSDRGGSRSGGSDRGSSDARTASQPSPHSVAVASGSGSTSPVNHNYGRSTGYYYYPNYQEIYARDFLYSLWRQYPYFALANYSFRYSLGDSPIDRNLLRLALQDSYESAAAMVNQVNDLSSLIDQLEAGQIERKQFQAKFDSSVSQIRKLAKTIKKDERLQFLDQRRGVSVKEPARAASIPEMRELVAQLGEQATAMRTGLENYYVRDYTRIVELDHLKQPSFKSISERIDKLAKAIEKSADRM